MGFTITFPPPCLGPGPFWPLALLLQHFYLRAEAWLRPRLVSYNKIAGGLAVVVTRRDRLCAQETAFRM